MGELTEIWMEIGSYNRYAETKLAFFIGLVVAVLSVINSASGQLPEPLALLRGGNSVVNNIGASISLAFALLAVMPDLNPSRRLTWFIPKRKPDNVYFFISIANYSTSNDWLAATGIKVSDDERPRAQMLAEQVYVNARIAARKFHLLRYALLVLSGGWCLSWLPACFL
ncbi:MAG: Pycsar system effector family protein [Rhizomicrobium sp.]